MAGGLCFNVLAKSDSIFVWVISFGLGVLLLS